MASLGDQRKLSQGDVPYLHRRSTGHVSSRRCSQGDINRSNRKVSAMPIKKRLSQEKAPLTVNNSARPQQKKVITSHESMDRMAPVPRLIPNARSSIVSQLTIDTESILNHEAGDVVPSDTNVVQKIVGSLDSNELDVLKSNLLSRLAELKPSFISDSTSIASAATKRSEFSNDFTITGVAIDDESCELTVDDHSNKDDLCETKEKDGTSSKIRTICRDRSNYDLLVSAVLNLSDRSLETYPEEAEAETEAESQDNDEVGEDAEDGDSVVSFSIFENHMGMFDPKASFNSSMSSLTKTIECYMHGAGKQGSKRSKSGLMKGLTSLFTKKNEKHTNDIALSKYLESKDFVNHFSAWKRRG